MIFFFSLLLMGSMLHPTKQKLSTTLLVNTTCCTQFQGCNESWMYTAVNLPKPGTRSQALSNKTCAKTCASIQLLGFCQHLIALCRTLLTSKTLQRFLFDELSKVLKPSPAVKLIIGVSQVVQTHPNSQNPVPLPLVPPGSNCPSKTESA